MDGRELSQSFSLSEMEMDVEWNLHCACTHHYSLTCQRVAVEDAPEVAHLLDTKREI